MAAVEIGGDVNVTISGGSIQSDSLGIFCVGGALKVVGATFSVQGRPVYFDSSHDLEFEKNIWLRGDARTGSDTHQSKPTSEVLGWIIYRIVERHFER